LLFCCFVVIPITVMIIMILSLYIYILSTILNHDRLQLSHPYPILPTPGDLEVAFCHTQPEGMSIANLGDQGTR
jgi:hypothetical protein